LQLVETPDIARAALDRGTVDFARHAQVIAREKRATTIVAKIAQHIGVVTPAALAAFEVRK
jgi:hypothetical protein